MSRLSLVPFALLASISFAQTANPLVRITSPATAVVETSAPSIVLTGVASGGATKVHWVDQIGHRGNARLENSVVDGGQNQVSWSTDAILLRPGTNQITVVVVDAQNHSSTATVAIVSTRSPSSLSLRPDIRTGVWRGQMVTYEVVNRLAIGAGDMILGTAEEVAAGSEIGNKAEAPKAGLVRRANSIDYTSLLWPRVGPVVQVPFTIQPGSASAAVANAVASFNASLSGFVQYVARGAEANYVTFNLSAADTSGACQSSVGMIGGQQFITGSGDCGVSTLVHEMGHSIGLYHEHQRTDNATFITANLANADKPLISGNFDAITSNQQNVGLYDFASVMQYPAFSFSKAGLPVLESIPAGIPLSNDVGFSLGDIDGIRRLYVYTPTQVTVTTNPPGLGIIVDGATLTAPQTFSWAIGSSHTLDLPADPQVTSPVDGSTYMYGRWNDSVTRSHSVIVTAGAGFLTSPSSSPAVTLYEANFIRLQPFGTAVFPGGTGTVSPSPAPQSIFSGTFYRDRQQITLTGTPTGVNHFAGWFNVPFPQSENPKTYFIQSPTSSATGGFTSAAVTLFGVSVTGPNPTNPGLFGTVDGNFEFLPQAFANDPNFGGAAWASGTSHTLAVSTPESPVTTNVRYLFGSWADAAPAVPSRSITAPSSGVQSFTAVFNPVYRTFPLLSPTCGGNVNFSPVSPTNDGFYADGSLLSVTAVPNPGISFGGWFGDLSGNTNPSNVTIHDQFIPGAFFNSTTTPISVTGFSPANTTITAGAMDLVVTGTGFTASTQAFWNLSFRSSTFNSSTQITMHLTAGDLAVAGGNRVSIQNVVNGCSLFVEGMFDVKSASTVWAITKTHTGTFNVGQQGATYNISVSNTGTVVSTASLTVTDTLPTGLTFVSGVGNFWSCGAVAQAVTCTYSLTVNPGGGVAQPLTITVNVATSAPVGTNSITNSATASGGGAANTPTASDPTTVLGPAVFTITKTHVGNFNVGQQNATYNILIGNTPAAGPTVGSTTVTDTLPTGLTFVSGVGNFWSCSAVAQVVTCTYSLVVSQNSNAQALTITVNVASNAPVGTNSITNSATVSGGGASNSPTANDPTTILGPAVFTITKTHVGNFNVGQQNATYNILIGNTAAAGPTVGSTTVTDTLPTGLTFVSGVGNFWSCSAVAQVVTCTYSLVVSQNSNAQALTITVNVASNAPVGTNSITNSATVSGGGASNSPVANDPTTILGPAVFTITKTHVGNFNVGQQNATYNILVGNTAAAGPTVGSTTVTDTLPSGLTFVSGVGNFWSCSAIAQVVTCTYSLVVSQNSTAQGLTITVNVASNAPVGTNSITNSATVSGGGASNSPTANDPTTILGPAVFTITKTHVGNFNVGQQNAAYNILVGNTAAAGPTVGSTTVTDTLPTGLTFVSGVGNFWSCSAVAQVVTCTYSLVVSQNSTAQGLTITVNVASNAPVGTNSITNSATVSGGGASNTPTANDPTTILGPAVFTITKTHVGNFNVGQQNAAYNILVGNTAAAGPTVGSTSVMDTLPTGLTFVSGVGNFWLCSAVAQVVTCTYSQVVSQNSNAQALTLTVNVANSVAVGTNSITNSATASGGGASNSPTASDPTTIVAGPPTSMALNAATTPQSTAVNTAFPVALAVTLKDVGNNPTPGINVTFTAPGAGASGKFSNNGTTIVVATDATGVASAPFTANATAAGPYNVTAAAGALTSVNFSLTNTAAGTAPVITLNPSNVTVNAGQLATFNANASGAPGPTVQWQVSTDGGATFNDVPGATSATLSFTASSGQNGNRYRAVMSNASGSATTTSATLTVNFGPTVTTNPTSGSVSAGSTATFVAAASGNPAPTVQWQVSTNGGGTFVNIAGATSTTLSFTAQASDNGNQYRAVFTNTVGSATTTAATLTVTAGPVITLNPVNVTLNAGQTATFTAAASGTPTPTVQWQFSVDGGATFNNVAGATTTTLTIPNVLAGQNGTKFRAVFTNGSGSATTTAATMTVDFAPTVTTNPTSQSVSAGSTATFVAAASGNPAPTVQWQVSINGGGTFVNIAGATSTTLSFTAQASDNGNQYRAVFTNTVGSATTTAATLTVTAGPVITLNPVNVTLNAGQTATFTAAASGTPTPTVQWQFSVDGGATFNNVAGATTTTLTIPNVLAGQNGTKFRAVFTNGSGSATTTAATMTVDFAPTVTTNPTSQSVSAGSTATFVAAASGNPAPTVQWQVSINGGGTFVNIAGATSTTLSFTAQASDNGNQYRAVFTNTVGSATTTAATLTVTAGPVITLNPVNTTVNAGQTATFTAAASGTPTPTVQWQFSVDGGATFNNVAGATTTTLTIPNVLAGQNGTRFRAVFTNGSGSATTTAATMTVDFAPTVTTNPTSQSVSAGSTATFVAAASGNPAPTVQWQVSTNGGGTFVNIAGATSTTLSFTAQASDNGNQYRAVFTNTVGSATTTAATLTVTAGPVITMNPVNTTLDAGQTATFTAAASGTPTPTVQWQFSVDGGATFNNVAGATTTTLSIPNVLAGQNGTRFRAVFTNGSGSATTTAATMTVDFAPTVTTNPTNISVNAGSTATFVAAASGNPTATVQWQLSTNGGGTFTNIAGATSTTLSFTAQATDNSHQYRAVFTNTVGSATTTAATLTISGATLQSIAVTPANPSSPKGATRQFTATGTYSDNSTQNITAQVTWASATPSVATIAAGGLATAVGTGTTTISATLSAISGSTVLTVTAAALQSIAVTPANPSIPKGTTQPFTATGTFSDNSTQNLTAQVTWASATTSVATITAGGLATGLNLGTSTISATLSGISGSTVLTVTTAILQSLAVTPANPSIPKGSTQQFAATGTFSDNSTQNLTGTVTWASATTSVATITAGGLATGVSTGTSSISATLSGVSGSTVLSVTAAVLQSIAVTPPNPSIAQATTQQFTATGTFSDNSIQNLTGMVTWASATPSVATITAAGLASGVGTGTSLISATLGGITGSTVLTVTTGSTGPTVVSFRVLFGTQSYNVTGSLRTRLPWQIAGIQVVFSAPITTADINSLTGVTTTGFSGLGTNTLTWTIVPVAQGALTASLLGSGVDAIKDAGGLPLGSGAGFNQNLKILWADLNDDGIVNASDLVLVNNARLAAYTIFADLNGDGLVDINDVQIARTRNGTTLP